MTEQIKTKIENRVLHIILNRPEKKNAITRVMYGGLAEALEKGENDKQVRVILVYGNGENFCAGNDLKDFQNLDYFKPSEGSSSEGFMQWMLKAKKPLIASVHGYAIGIGATMLLHFDLLYAAEDAKLQFPFTNLGLVPEFGSSFNLPELVGKFRATELFFFGDFFTGLEAHKMGIINKVFPKEELFDKVKAIAELLAEKAPTALKSTKALIKKHHRGILEKYMPEEGAEFRRRQKSPEAQEAFTAFFGRRKPDFSKFD